MLLYQGSCYADIEAAYHAVCGNMPLVQGEAIYSCVASSSSININATHTITGNTFSYTITPSFEECTIDTSSFIEFTQELYILPVAAFCAVMLRRILR